MNKILIVDDDTIYHIITKRILKNKFKDCETHIALNGLEALEKVSNNEFDMILLDINMPKMNGWEFLKALKKKKIKLSSDIYIVSSSIDDQDIKSAKKNPLVTDFIEKPLNESKIPDSTKK